MERLEIRLFSSSLKDARSKPHPSLNGHTPKSPLSSELVSTITTVFDKHLERLSKFKAQIPICEAETAPQPRRAQHPDILPQTVVAIDRMLNPPLLPPPKQPTFEESFKRFEPMFHTVFYRRYHPLIREDMKQVALIALFKKWRKDPGFLRSHMKIRQAGV